MKAHDDKTINIIRGKVLVSHQTQKDVETLFEHIDALESFLDEHEVYDVFGTEGWRHSIGIAD